MIRRINQIANVGCYRNMRASNLQFAPLTLIYGENCNGKTTLCDIFRSLSENKPEYIGNRVSIPVNGNPNVQISVNIPGTNNETLFTFTQNAWNNALGQINLMIFDTNFIHRNVFTGLSIERRNQENVTEFILGEQSVVAANRIADLNSAIRSIRLDINRLTQTYFTNIQNLNNFINMQVNLDEATIDSEINRIPSEIEKERSLQGNIQGVMNRAEPNPLQIPTGLVEYLDAVNQALQANYQIVHQNAKIEVQRHIEQNCKCVDSSKNWINLGLTLINTDVCPFCGQKLEENSNRLLEMYRECFDKAYNDYTTSIKSTLENLSARKSIFQNFSISQTMHKNTLAISHYIELIDNTSFSNSLNSLNLAQQRLFELQEQWITYYNEFISTLESKIQEKKENLYISINTIVIENVINAFNSIVSNCVEYNNQLEIIKETIISFKSSLDSNSIGNRITELSTQLLQYQTQKRRLQLETHCQTYTQLTTNEQNNRNEVNRLNTELRAQQTTFLSQCFSEINRIFRLLGSNNFTISQTINNRGNMPVIQVTASYNGVPVTNTQLESVFSESDRRALAFSIFWARITRMQRDEAIRTVVILDDPITSFDNGRIDRTIRMIETERANLRQVIIFCHYSNYLSAFYLWANNNPANTVLYSLRRDANGTTIVNANPSDFTESINQRKWRKINDFVEGRTQDDIFADLRVFLETEVRNRYWLQINRNDLAGLQFSELLRELLNRGYINQICWNMINQLRQTLNIEHHVWTERVLTEKVGIANDVLTAVFDHL